MVAKFNCWKTCGPLLRAKVRRVLFHARTSGRCDGFIETKGFLSSYFHVEGADEGLARQLLGDNRINAAFTLRNQEHASKTKALPVFPSHLGYIGAQPLNLTACADMMIERYENNARRHCRIGKVALKPRLAAE